MSNKFTFYTPVEINKSKDDKGNDIMKIGGIASTSDEDSDGEFLDPNGFILDDFLNVGFVNWHHQSKNKPKTIVGEPSLAEIRPDGLYVECLLYPSSDIAKEIYETAEILERDSKTRRLGFSIEGEVIERESDDENDPLYNKIKKANITGLAITHMPKNAATFAQIIKGFTGGDDSIGDSISSEESEDSEGLNTKNGKAIIKESLDKKIKKVNQFTENIVKSKYEIIDLDKEKMIYKIFNSFTDINIEKAEKVFMLLTKISHDMKKGKINDDHLEKAMSALGLNIDEANPFLQKAKDESDDDDSDDDGGEADDKVKAAAKKVADKVQKEEFGKSDKKDDKKVEKAESDDDSDDEEEDEKIEKSKTATTIGGNNGLFLLVSKEIQKAKNQSTVEARALGVLVKGVLDENQLLKGQIAKQNDFFEKQSDMIDSQTELIKALSDKLETFGAAPNDRKAITKSFVEKFDDKKDENLEKGSNTLSKSKDRGKILEVLDIRSFAKGFDEEFSKACMTYESTGEISPAIAKRLQLETGIIIAQ